MVSHEMKDYKKPILSGIFDFVGHLVLVGAGILVIAGITIGLPLFPTIGVALALVVTAMIYLGVAQAIDFLGRTAHSTEKLCMLVASLIEQQSEDSRTLDDAFIREVAQTEPAKIREQPRFYISDGGEAKGPYTISAIHTLLQQGTITAESVILRQGTVDWQQLSSVREFKSSEP